MVLFELLEEGVRFFGLVLGQRDLRPEDLGALAPLGVFRGLDQPVDRLPRALDVSRVELRGRQDLPGLVALRALEPLRGDHSAKPRDRGLRAPALEQLAPRPARLARRPPQRALGP